MSSPSIIAGIRQFLVEFVPFSQMDGADVEFIARRVELAYFAHGEHLVSPADGSPQHFYIVKQGVVRCEGPVRLPVGNGSADPGAHLGAGEMFPVGALTAERSVQRTYSASGDVFCWVLAKKDFDELIQSSPVFLEFCHHRLGVLLDLSRRAVQASYALEAAQVRLAHAPLTSVMRSPPVTAGADETLRAVFLRMEQAHVGSVVVTESQSDGSERPVGIFTKEDLLGRVVLPELALVTPIRAVMSAPVETLTGQSTVADAMLLMASRTIRHIPIVDGHSLVGLVSERNLFELQRRSLRQMSEAIRAAQSAGELASVAGDVRESSKALVAQGVGVSFVTRLISGLNDKLTSRLIEIEASATGLSLARICWIALGSEGREEQTIATDQDNGIVIADGADVDPDVLQRFADGVNRGLDVCGFPLCKGDIMARNPMWSQALARWQECFDNWIDSGDPQSILRANIFFDFRALAGNRILAASLRTRVTQRAAANVRFLKQMSDNALQNGPPHSWVAGVLESLIASDAAEVDLKMQGTVPFVDGARVLALAHGIRHTGTAERLRAVAELGRARLDEVEDWIAAFQFLLGLRLRVQHRSLMAAGENQNVLDTRTLSRIDRHVLKESFREARKLQQRLAADYPG